jgi:hypothetical protein
MKIQTQTVQPTVDITELFLILKEQHRNVFIFQADSQIFIYRTLGRGEYKKILTDDRFEDMAKEELICQVCTLYPEEYNFDECDAGIPTVLMQQIVKNSRLDGEESRREILDYYRSEMWDLDNQVTCIINEAFPQFDIEEIEQWDIEKTTKYLSRAEWKLHNLRGLQFLEPQGGYQEDGSNAQTQQTNGRNDVHTEEVKADNGKKEEKTNIRGGKREKLTPEKLRQLKAQFPDIDWEADGGMQGIEGLAQEDIDPVAPALRPGF